ncbi:hypothetical protein HYT24_03310, partial [Candidatus Pacearchaeota archaeon]|nr:hypothetical protein [Candidatus Pacearchaeota archaeon]
MDLTSCYDLAAQGNYLPDYCVEAAKYIMDVAQNRQVGIFSIDTPLEFFGLAAFITTPFVVLGFQAAPTIRDLYREYKMGKLETK